MFCPCKDCLLIPTCKNRTLTELTRLCKPLDIYLFRYCQDTAPGEIGGYNDRAHVLKRILGGEFFLLLSKHEEAIKIMMEDGDDKPISIQYKIENLGTPTV